MKTKAVETLLLLLATSGLAATHYVDLNSPNPTPPYTNWATAATVIQDAVDAAATGDEVLVTNGIYATGGRSLDGVTTNRVAVDKPLTLRSANGPEATLLDGSGTMRCCYLTNSANLFGFILTNGTAGLFCESVSAVVSNCQVVGNSEVGAYQGTLFNCTITGNQGGGAAGDLFADLSSCTLNNCSLIGNSAYAGAGAYACTLNKCVLTRNSAAYSGGGVLDCTLTGCTLTDNSAQQGGGATDCTLNNCALSGNSAFDGGADSSGEGGGAYESTLINCALYGNQAAGAGRPASGGGASSCTLNNCTLAGNWAVGEFAGVNSYGGGAANSRLNNCTLTGNAATNSVGGPFGAGSGGGASASSLNNCLVVDNSADYAGGGVDSCRLNNCMLTGNSATNGGGGAVGSSLDNCTMVGNLATGFRGWFGTIYPGYGGGSSGCMLSNCIVCSNSAAVGANYDTNSVLNYCCTTPLPINGFGNITNAPLLVDLSGGNLRLQSNSPCINAGNNAFALSGPDLDGNPRIVAGTVDIGAYEFQTPTSVIAYAWLQQYGLPTDGSADFTDPDSDSMNNWQEWRCGTDPTNALSVLRMLSAVPTRTNVIISWESVAGVNYFIERTASLAAPVSFTPLATNLPGQGVTTTYSDTNALGPGPFFYRVSVR